MDKYICLSPVYNAAAIGGHSMRIGLWFDKRVCVKGGSTIEA
jgi:hypothetical protein